MTIDEHALLGPYVLHALDALESRRFERHVVTCVACRGELATAMEASAGLDVIRPDVRP